MNLRIARQINQMAEADRKMRSGHKKGVILDASLDKRHAEALKAVIKQYGWPTISLVGRKASRNAWLIAQHADHDQKFQEMALCLLRKIDRESHDIDRANIAYLADRLAVKKKQKQQFGTQFDFDKNGNLVLHPLTKSKDINQIRKDYNLPSLDKFLKMADEFNAKLKKKRSSQ